MLRSPGEEIADWTSNLACNDLIAASQSWMVMLPARITENMLSPYIPKKYGNIVHFRMCDEKLATTAWAVQKESPADQPAHVGGDREERQAACTEAVDEACMRRREDRVPDVGHRQRWGRVQRRGRGRAFRPPGRVMAEVRSMEGTGVRWEQFLSAAIA